MNIGKEQREIIVEPLEWPQLTPQPQQPAEEPQDKPAEILIPEPA